jgi:hypothetical protein
MSDRREVMARLIWEAAYPDKPMPTRRNQFLAGASVQSAAFAVLAVLDRGDGPVEHLELILQETLYRAGVNNPLSGAARLVNGPLARWVA